MYEIGGAVTVFDERRWDALEDYFVCITECDLNDQNWSPVVWLRI